MMAEAVALWNEAAARCGWPIVRRLTADRERKVRGLIRNGLGDWREALAKAEASDFLCGRTERRGEHAGWRFNFDFFITESRFVRLLEGLYDNKETTLLPVGKSPEVSQWEARLRGWKDGKGMWLAAQWGPPPGQPGCQVPARVLDERKAVH